jgi:hypothetical protein
MKPVVKQVTLAIMSLAFAGTASAATLTLYTSAPASLTKALARAFSKKPVITSPCGHPAPESHGPPGRRS